MYVELNSRQTGKTTRLVDSVIDFLLGNPDKTALIVAPNHYNRKHIQERVYFKCGRDCLHRTITSYKMLPPIPNATLKQFVDEFGAIDDLVIDPEAYYVGTPPLNEKASEILHYYKNMDHLKPNNIIKKHKL